MSTQGSTHKVPRTPQKMSTKLQKICPQGSTKYAHEAPRNVPALHKRTQHDTDPENRRHGASWTSVSIMGLHLPCPSSKEYKKHNR